MSSQNESFAQKYYSNYFPSILNQSSTDPEYLFPSPFVPHDSGNNLILENDGTFKCKLTKNEGFIANFYKLLEGIPETISFKYYELIKDKKFKQDISKFNQFNSDLYQSSSKAVLDYLTNDRGISSSTLNKYKIGYDSKNNKVIFPVLNVLGNGITAYKSFGFPVSQGGFSNSMNGYSRLFDYNNLRFNYKTKSQYIFTIDEFDALLLSQLGYDVLCPISTSSTWYPDWNHLIECKEIYIISDDVKDVLNYIKEFGCDTAKYFMLSLKSTPSEYFVKNGKTKNDLDQLISSALCIDKDYIKNFNIIKQAKADQLLFKEINAPQDYIDDKMFFGIIISDELRLITSDKKNLDLIELSSAGYNLRNTPFESSNFSLDGIDNFLINNYKVDLPGLFKKLRDHITKHIFIENKDVYDILTLWVMGTYVFRIFRKFPYLHIQADKSSGKSTLLELLKPLCFNGKLYVEPTASVVFRDVDQNSTTLLLDEVENLKSTRSSVYSKLMSILNSGYSVSGSVPRSATSQGITNYKTYSPKIFAGINEVGDTLSSRSIKIIMKRKLKDEKIERYREDGEMIRFLNELRDDLYIFALQFAKDINSKYNDGNYSNKQLDNMDGRPADNYTPLFILGEIIESKDQSFGTTITDAIAEYFKVDDSIHQTNDSVDNETSRILESLNTILKKVTIKKFEEENGAHFLYVETNIMLSDYLKLSENKGIKLTQTKFTRKLKKLEIENKVIAAGNVRCYEINLEKLKQTGERSNVVIEIEEIINKHSNKN